MNLLDLFNINLKAFIILSVLNSIIIKPIQSQDKNTLINFSNHNCLPIYTLKKLGNTAIFQGNNKKKNYFEGWYFKMVSIDGSSILSAIPGISLSKDGKKQTAFIQIINGITAETYYFSFPIEDFYYSKKDFVIGIGNNYFSKDSISLNIKSEKHKIFGKVKMNNIIRYTSGSLINPGIMGWYRFVPFMECYHGVVSLNHDLKGKIIINNISHNFDNGKGYIEKDWGSSMPSSWIWMQSNNFSHMNSSFMLSIANVPWLNKSFTGFLGFYYFNNKVYPLGTYKSNKLNLEIDTLNQLKVKIRNRKNTILLETSSQRTGILKAPVEGNMDRRIAESIDSYLKIILLDKKGKIIHQDSTRIAGLEMVGDIKSLVNNIKD